MTKRGRATYHHGDLRQALFTSAVALLDSAGIAGLTIRAVAHAAGVSHAAPVNHFADRRALLTALATDFFGDIQTLAVEKMADAPAGEARLVAFAEAMIDYALAHPNRFRLLWRRDLLDDADTGLNTAMDSLYDRLLVELQAGGWPLRFDVETYAIGLWSLVHGYLSMRLDGNLVAAHDARTGEPRHRAIIAAFLASVAPPPT
ncbi:MAG: TetR/AcrR family transcriptional regulator [Alphaproteobacteria bacterium]|nr:TetR/AcrR family transcriptional regulator [Alphaproteobacteria bacterium]MBU1513313.1 TetR/AcrR family transcriptional regulator [Alphaproteobacteria bacterium]MBU2096305.1 TetR/AcrR family transcriptional regulator [Alphaproteobacteria bacterium]MBU2152847.1 TetR/AcrR family transcriptional regulator [Alphaproteobacteria bacterium]MBU2306187.1 TetR/AcrR family transcriptional regulator [Alphaproteobacteria bacterium]